MTSKIFRKFSVYLMIMAVCMLTFTLATEAGTFTSYTYNSKTYKVFVPDGYQSGVQVPMVVMLHGCTQDPDQFAAGTEMNVLAEQENFIVVYPDQPSSANQNKCWNWFETSHQSRGYGEPAHIVGIVNTVKGKYSIDDNRVYVTGLSGGAAMSVIMGVTYPDVFAAIGVGSGLEYKAATSMTDAFTAMSNGGPNPEQQGNTAYNAMGSYARVVPTIVFHGTSDYTVYPVNGNQVISQMAQTNDRASDGTDNNNIDDVADETVTGQVAGGYSYTQYIYQDENGKVVMEKYLVDGMGHAWSGGSTAGSYTDPKGPSQTEAMWRFFTEHPLGGSDTIAPITTANPVGGEYSGSVTVELTTNEVATTYYSMDGSTPTTSSQIYNSPLTITGTTTLKYYSVDTSGNTEAVKAQTYTITDDITAPVTTANPTSGTYNNSVTVELLPNEPATTYYTLDGSTPTTSSIQYSSAITISTNTTVKFFSVDAAGNVETVKSETYSITQSEETTFSSIGTEDGFAGMFSADGLSASNIKVGDKGFYNGDTYRGILSFDTSSLPDNAVIESAVLRVYRKSLSGTVTGMNVDMISGYFGELSGLEQGDYNNTASSTDVVALSIPASNGGYAEVSLGSGAFAYINKTGKTQFRLKPVSAADYTSDVLELYGGEDGGYAPVLVVTYGGNDDTTAPVTSASPQGGTYSSSQSVTLTANEEATTYYTVDGSTPTTASNVYNGPISISENTTLKFFSIDVIGNQEGVKTEVYTITVASDTTPPVTTATPAGGTYSASQTVELAVNEPGTTYYTVDGSTPTTSSNQYTGPISITADTTLKFYSIDTAGNIENIQTEVYDIVTTTEVTFTSVASEDGFVGQYVTDGLSTTTHQIGDKGMYNLDTYRTILSFDTASLPDNVQITSAKLRIYRKSLSGTVNSVSIDMVKGYFGTVSTLESGDYNAAPSASAATGAEDVAILSVPTANNSYTEVALPASALQFINTVGKTQFRLQGDTNYDFTSDLLEIYGGENSTYAPVLILTY